MVVYLVRYALSTGVTQHEVTLFQWHGGSDLIELKHDGYPTSFRKGVDVFGSYEEAESAFHLLVEKKRQSLLKQLNDLETKEFRVNG